MYHWFLSSFIVGIGYLTALQWLGLTVLAAGALAGGFVQLVILWPTFFSLFKFVVSLSLVVLLN